MKKLSFILPVLLATIVFIGCEKDNGYLAERTSSDGTKAFLKVNYASAFAANPSVQVSINKERVSNLIVGRTPFPGGGYNTNGNSVGNYLVVNPPAAMLNIAYPFAGTNTDSFAFVMQGLILKPNTYYTAHVADTGVKAKVFLIQDDLSTPDTPNTRFTFVNLMPNVPAIDLYYGSTVVASNIAYGTSSPAFLIKIPTTAVPVQTFTIRETGTGPTGTALATYSNSAMHLNQRVYTAFAMGYKGSTDNNRKPYVSFVVNK